MKKLVVLLFIASISLHAMQPSRYDQLLTAIKANNLKKVQELCHLEHQIEEDALERHNHYVLLREAADNLDDKQEHHSRASYAKKSMMVGMLGGMLAWGSHLILSSLELLADEYNMSRASRFYGHQYDKDYFKSSKSLGAAVGIAVTSLGISGYYAYKGITNIEVKKAKKIHAHLQQALQNVE